MAFISSKNAIHTHMPSNAVRKSIYVAVSVLERDSELPVTILSCLQNRSGNNDVSIGVAYISTDEAFASQQQESPDIFSIPNVIIRHFPLAENYGIGKGRNAAYSMYGDEDYVLQVDAHSYFVKDWDSKLIETHSQALKITNNERTVVTGVPEPYWYPSQKNYELDYSESDVVGYPYWMTGWWWVKDAIPRWRHKSPSHVTMNLEKLVTETGFAPAIKVTGAFMFSTRILVQHVGLHPEFLFWEEEIVQSIELINSGFSLVYPYVPCPILHMYCEEKTEEYGNRENVLDLAAGAGFTGDIFEEIEKNMQKYFTNPDNKNKIKSYEAYAGIYLGDANRKMYFKFNNLVRRNQYEYANVGAYPID